jgi:hypothetical protein
MIELTTCLLTVGASPRDRKWSLTAGEREIVDGEATGDLHDTSLRRQSGGRPLVSWCFLRIRTAPIGPEDDIGPPAQASRRKFCKTSNCVLVAWNL